MRRAALAIAIATLALLLMLCGAGTVRAWSAQGQRLVMPGASEVRIERDGAFGLHVAYRLPRGQTLHGLTQYLAGQGWRRIKLPNVDRTTLSFARPGWAAQAREILVITFDDRDRRLVDLRFGRCIRVSSWVKCS